MYVSFVVNSIFNSKVRKAFLGRFGLWKRYKQNLPEKKNKKRIWFHVSSVGEMEQAKPLIRLLAKKRPSDVEIVLTYFSPSAMRPASRISEIIFCDYLPLDTYFNSKKVFDLIKPDVIVFVKFDIWPNIVWEAKERNIPSILIDGTLHRASKRYSNFIGQSFYDSIYMAFDFIGVVSDSDLKRFLITSPKHKNVKIMGDTRFDQVAFRAFDQSNVNKKIPAALDEYKNGVTLICGSTWENDDKNIIVPLINIMEDHANLNLVMVPHEPNEKRVLNYMNLFADFSPVRLSDIRNGATCSRVTIVDEVGALAELYKMGDIAYVGGAFSTGVHNVMEPAIMGLPVVFGPFYYNSPEAEALVRMNCAFSGNSPEMLYSCFKKLVADNKYMKDTGTKAQTFIKNSLGADERYYQEVTRFV
ncbi:MAG: glycosyltransferase N-terminal domain-containing protein [Pseudomonadota bacterium]